MSGYLPTYLPTYLLTFIPAHTYIRRPCGQVLSSRSVLSSSGKLLHVLFLVVNVLLSKGFCRQPGEVEGGEDESTAGQPIRSRNYTWIDRSLFMNNPNNNPTASPYEAGVMHVDR